MSPTGWYGLICALCFGELTLEECYVDERGEKWDMHSECAAADARAAALRGQA